MRYLLGLIALAGFAAVCWLAIFKGTDYPHLQSASQISEKIRAEAKSVVKDASTNASVQVEVDGRNVHLSGDLSSADEISTLMTIVAAVPMVGSVNQDFAIVEDSTSTKPNDETAAVTAVAQDHTAVAVDTAPPSQTGAPERPLPVAEPTVPAGVYFMRASKTVDGTILLSGKVPDKSTRTALITAAEAITDVPVIEKLVAADDFPSTIWLNLNRQGLEALAWMESGDLSTTGSEVSLSGAVSTNADLEQLLALANPDWNLDVTVRDTEPDAEVSLNVDVDASITGGGLLPKDLSVDDFVKMLPGLSVSGFSAEGTGRQVDWTPALDGLSIVLPRLESAQVRLKHKQLFMSGTLKDGYSIAGLEASLRTAMTDGWTLSINVDAPPPESELILSKADDRVELAGVLPRGVPPSEALSLFGESAGATGLTEGGAGEAANWRNALTGTAEMLQLFSDATGAVSKNKISLNGTLKSGYDAKSVHSWQSERTGSTWAIELEADTAASKDGDTRRILVEDGDGFGDEEQFVSGFWLPLLTFTPSVESCSAETAEQQKTGKVIFITSSARLDQNGREALDRIGAVLLRCAEREDLQLEIGGHTDSVGNDAANLRLSEKRAQVVLDEMVKRGVRAGLMTAVGYGENEPIASNNTADGRARNRRITFSWSDGGR